MYWKYTLFVLMSFVIVAGLSFPIVSSPSVWYEFPLIPGLEEKAKIIFFHVPTAWLSVISFLMAMVYGIKYLSKKNLDDDAKSNAALQLGMIFTILATVTGSIWAKFTWGAFWHWDPRETSIFILLLIYGSLFALRSAIENEDKRARLSAVYSIFAFLTVPFFIFIMPRIMPGLHPGSANDTNSGPVVDFQMNANMMLVFYLSLTAFTILYFWMWNIGYKTIIIKDKLSKKLI
ncbi:MAG: cytochrome c biogenesis protein CcsA [Melioribacteraceae bacterium]|nr:cytochrome c biogenesis protein CcsA [Melioribacteraceae bacterium]MCF8263119.1 cytochrome c biogenesis protein CcsA [Melioribacteraceae bacterium]MCF8413832.1 cytochrome c biogenesis protein CcsA [Melioribacteraceae bacterium]MCF8430549.1 cytochrome c biogenesis protein CcsA [Melioribacteraceae bacterium]